MLTLALKIDLKHEWYCKFTIFEKHWFFKNFLYDICSLISVIFPLSAARMLLTFENVFLLYSYDLFRHCFTLHILLNKLLLHFVSQCSVYSTSHSILEHGIILVSTKFWSFISQTGNTLFFSDVVIHITYTCVKNSKLCRRKPPNPNYREYML